MSEHYDVIVVGSGFGGAVTACRMAQQGMRVCILERGRWWSPETYPLHNSDPGDIYTCLVAVTQIDNGTPAGWLPHG